MKQLMWLLRWGLKAAIFFTLFAFALNNPQDVTVHFFFGAEWRAPMVLVLLAAFSAGLIAGILGMFPRWWSQRRLARRARRDADLARDAADSALAQTSISPYGH
ncbi:MAG: LapA family protein [Hylemonella sp.]|nr:LapA family protein [Hylemonella sp.]MDH5709779.1 LapA family protein [Hylemonella sp.]